MQKLFWLGGAVAAAAWGILAPHASPPPPPPAAESTFIDLPPHFEPTAQPGTFAARGAGFALELGALGAQVRLARGATRDSISLGLEGASLRQARPEHAMPGVSHYFIGSDPKAWRTRVPHFARVRYEDVYPGIDLVYYGARDALEYDFVVAPGADPARIRMNYSGARSLSIDSAGNLRIGVSGGELMHRSPVSFQTINGKRHPVHSRFKLESGTVSFELGDYDRSLPLIIDPVLSYATYLGGTNNNERIDSLHADAAGALYVAGQTNSSNFPVSAGVAQGTHGGGVDSFIAKLNPAGTAFEYVTYLGGSDTEESHALRVDAAGNAYLAGSTMSANFPVTAGAAQVTYGGNRDAFVVKLSATGGTLLYGTYIGGSEGEPSSSRLGGFEVDANGDAYVLGDTASTNLPTTASAPQATRGNPNAAQFDEDLFLTRINAAGTAFSFSTYHGGSGIDATSDDDIDPRLLAIDANGIAWIAGTTESADMPTTAGAYDTTFNGPAGGTPGGGDALVARFDTGAGSRTYSTYVGGTSDEQAMALAVDSSGSAHLATRTQSNNFPLTAGAPDAVYGGGGDATLTKFNAAGSGLTYSSYLGGGLNDSPEQIRLHSDGSLYVAGNTRSPDFPATAGAADSTFNTGFDGFVARLNPSGSAFLYATYIGTADENALFHLEVDAAGSAYVVLEDLEGDMTLTPGGRAHAGDLDDLFVKINPAGSAFLDVSYLGGADTEYATAFAIDTQENVYLGGTTGSTNYPTTAGAPQPAKAGAASSDDTYLAKFATTPAGPVAIPGTVALSEATYSVSENSATAALMVTRTGGAAGAISVSCSAATAGSNSAAAGTDYTAVSTTLNWADGDAASKTCSVTIANDAIDESDETFTVSLSNVTGGATLGAPATAVVTIVDDDAAPVPQPGTVQFDPSTYSANENGGSVTLTLTRTLGADGAISVSVASGGGSATAASDYTALTQTVTWADGDSTAKTVSLTLLDDSTDEPDETVSIALSNATGGATLGGSGATVTILDNDAAPPPPAPVSQTTTVTAKYGKGSLDAWLLAALGAALCVVIARRRRLALAGAALITVSATGAAADGWYAGVRAGVAQTTQEDADLQRGLSARGHDVTLSLDDRHTEFTLLAGYRWENGLALETGLSNLGEFTAGIDATTHDPASLARDTLSLLGDGGRALSASVAWHLPLGKRLDLVPRVGGYYWESTREVSGVAGVLRDRDHGYDLTAGLLLSMKMEHQWSVGVGIESWAARGNNDVRTWVLEVRKDFGRD